MKRELLGRLLAIMKRGPVECLTCTDEVPRSEIVSIESMSFCYSCIRSRFEAAVKCRYGNYPVKVGKFRVPEPDDLPSEVLSPDLRRAYYQKKKEYAVAPEDQIFCKAMVLPQHIPDDAPEDPAELDRLLRSLERSECATFVGKKLDNHIMTTVPCPSCFAAHCEVCGKTLDALVHQCVVVKAKEEEGMIGKRGKEYQICPNNTCKARICLKEACNHMECCGKPVIGGVTHWQIPRAQGGCPQFNHPDEPNATWRNGAPNQGRVIDFAALDDPQAEMLLAALRALPRRNAVAAVEPGADVPRIFNQLPAGVEEAMRLMGEQRNGELDDDEAELGAEEGDR
ncbi:hypothetical protein LTR37_003905 [Vermiconidia calcicola]|uniref:Uncharacterized protein n=1 Tax=Vermiconidia calcicola TaxID=1690605 RepID=A0ACC3NNZ7_9PEZI|nr:hypothetical protein LTR37_003905 [Vermiconidia calcicola]